LPQGRGVAKGDKCDYLHDKKAGGGSGTKPMVSVIVCGLQGQRESEDRVLVDSGANEVVRPFSSSWWNEIIVLRNKGKPVTVKLAGGQEIRAAMTQHGEIMLPGREDQDKVGWILPVSRMTKELGIKVTWGPQGFTLTHLDGREVKARTEQGLAFLDWADFAPIRAALIDSHRQGRLPVGVRPEVREVHHDDTGVDPESSVGVSRALEGEASSCQGWLKGPMNEDGLWVNAMCAGDKYDPECGECKRAIGDRRLHRKGAMNSKWAMSADLSGPHPVAVGTKYSYLLVAVVTTDEPGQNLPFVRGLSSKRAEEVSDALDHIIAELEHITEKPNIVTRFHSDAGG